MVEQPRQRRPESDRRPLSRPTILVKALEVIDQDGVEALNMRRLSDELGVGTMSLYHHVPNKDALLDGIVETVLEEIELPAPSPGTWEEKASAMARSFREACRRHPNCVPLLVTRPYTTPAALRPVEAALQVLHDGGFDAERALITYRTLVAYTLGYVMMESCGYFGDEDCGPADLEEEGLLRLADLAPHLGERDAAADFDGGLALITAGARRYSRAPRRNRR